MKIEMSYFFWFLPNGNFFPLKFRLFDSLTPLKIPYYVKLKHFYESSLFIGFVA